MVCLGFEPGAAGWKAQRKPQCFFELLLAQKMF